MYPLHPFGLCQKGGLTRDNMENKNIAGRGSLDQAVPALFLDLNARSRSGSPISSNPKV
jgi:hypothetical protein